MKITKTIALAAVLSIAGASRAQTFSEGIFNFEVHRGNKVILKKCTATSGEVKIPSSVKYDNVTYSVDSIAGYAFSDKSGVTVSPVIPSSVEGIGDGAFGSSRSNRKGVTMTGTLILPNSLKHIGSRAFAGKEISGKLQLPAGLVTLGKDVFDNCQGITSVHFKCSPVRSDARPATLGKLPGLTNFYFYAKDLRCTEYSNCCLFSSPTTESIEIYVDGRVEVLDMSNFSESSGNVTTKYYLRFGTSAGNPLSVINSSGDKLGNIYGSFELTDRSLAIGEKAFYASNLESVTLGENVVSLGKNAFANCGKLSSVYYNADLAAVDGLEYVFDEVNEKILYDGPFCRWDGVGPDVTIGPKTKKIPFCLFANGGVKSVTLEANSKLAEIGPLSFCGNDLLTEFSIPESVKTIGDNAFQNCPLKELTFPEGLEAFNYQDLSGAQSGYDLPGMSRFTYKATHAVGCLDLKTDHLVVGPNVESIDFAVQPDLSGYIAGCHVKAKKVTILSEKLKHIGYISEETDTLKAPYGLFCEETDSIGQFVKGGDMVIDCGGFLRIPDNFKFNDVNPFYYKYSKIKDFRKLYYGTDAVSLHDILGDRSRGVTLDSLIVGKNVRTLTFESKDYELPYMKTLAFTENCPLDSIGSVNVSALQGDLRLPESLRFFPSLKNTVGLTSVNIPSALEGIGAETFMGCISLNCELPFHERIKEIGIGAFLNCSALEGEINLPNSLEQLGYNAFKGTRVSKINIPDSPKLLKVTSNVDKNGGWIVKSKAMANKSAEASAFIPKEIYQGRNMTYPVVSLSMSTSTVYCSPFNEDTTLVKAVLGDYVTCVQQGQFMNDTRLRFVHLGERVDTIRRVAFSGCSSLERIEITSKKMPVLEGSYWDSTTSDAFRGVDKNVLEVVVDDSLVENYKADKFWSQFKIVALSTSGIGDATIKDGAAEVARYSLDGKRLNAPVRGMNMVKYSDGSIRKEIIK